MENVNALLVKATSEELRELLTQWHSLEVNPNATARDFTRIGAKIREVCDQLDKLDNISKSDGSDGNV